MKKFLAACLCALCAACVWQPITYDESSREATESALEAFRAGGELDGYFDEAVAYAVFPGSMRVGNGFGGALGNGWLFEGEEVTGKTMLVEFFFGANLGGQVYRTILFFRNDEVLRRFREGRFEFTGQANATAVTLGKSMTPSFDRDVAMFVQVRGGLLLEASVGAHRYEFFPLATTQAP